MQQPTDGDYRVPKRTTKATLHVQGCPPRDVEIFLSDAVPGHAGPERPSDLLSGRTRFFPVRDPEDGVVLVHVESVVMMTVELDVEQGGSLSAEDLAGAASARADLDVLLTDGRSVRGVLSWLLPEGQQRLLDVLNRAAPCVVLRDADRAHVVRTACIARVRALDDGTDER